MEEVSQEDIRMGYPQVEVVVALAVNDLPARIAVGMSGKGVNLHRDVLRPEARQKALHIGNAAEILPPNGKEGGHIGEVLPGQLRSQVPCAIDAQECVFCARQPVIFIRNIVREILINRLVVGKEFNTGISCDAAVGKACVNELFRIQIVFLGVAPQQLEAPGCIYSRL